MELSEEDLGPIATLYLHVFVLFFFFLCLANFWCGVFFGRLCRFILIRHLNN